MCFYGGDSYGWKASSYCLLFGLKRSCSSLEELADVRFQALVTPAGQEAIRFVFFLTTAVR